MLIAHLADIQIRALKRHKEFLDHFDNLYASLREKSPDAIVICGDIVHQKLVISPELVQILSDFFKNLSLIAPVYVIPGNHDALIGQKTRLDALSPVIKNINDTHPVFYLKHSCVYHYSDKIDFIVFSCLDDEEEWPEKSETNKEKINIGLYHGMVDGCVLDNNFVMENVGYDLDYFFDKVDYLLMGDIHKRQGIGKKEIIETEVDEEDLEKYLKNGWSFAE